LSAVLNVWTVRPDGTQPTQITDQPGESRQPWWSPDGTLAFSADANVDNVHPAWSPDGHSVVFTSGTEADGAIYIFDFD